MSYRSTSHQRAADPPAEPKPSSRKGGRSRAARTPADYTLVHAGRQVRIGPIAFWLAVSGLLVMALWSAGTATYFAFRDDLLTRLIARQAEMQHGYEDRITELRAQVDRLTSRQLLDQEQVEQKIGQLVRRQSTLESRAAAMSGLPDLAATGTIKPVRPALPRPDNAGPAALKPSPINDTVILAPSSERDAGLESRVPAGQSARLLGNRKAAGIEATLVRLAESLDRVEARQGAALIAVEESYDAKARRMRGVLADLGLDVGKVATAGPAGAIGGPFVQVSAQADAGGFERQLYRIQLARNHVDRLSRALLAVPVRKPLAGELETSSGFGVRLDPFVRAPAMHTGLDFRSATGEPVRATAAGKVVSAGWSGGYGRMIEIDHGNGFSTRYGHLSELLVSEDQAIKPGQLIGRVGSTGRSTGPHLHYETRIDGDAVDPHKFLRAGLRLGEKS
jgi:murein DD-endopeptidase MepM/ murein hydrolase activator NlpD